MLGVIVIYVVLFGGLWWFMMRPQKKEQKRIQAMLASMEVGDTALTTSGFYGVIIDIIRKKRSCFMAGGCRTAFLTFYQISKI